MFYYLFRSPIHLIYVSIEQSERNPWLGLMIMIIVFTSIGILNFLFIRIEKIPIRKKRFFQRINIAICGSIYICQGVLEKKYLIIGSVQIITGIISVAYALFYKRFTKLKN